MSWEDPLRVLGRITEHPSRDSSINPALSSVLSDEDGFEAWSDAHKDATQRLNQYQPIEAGDITVEVLRIFLKELPKKGQVALLNDIIAVGQDDGKLRALKSHLVDAILKPMQAARGRVPRSPISSPVTDAVTDIQQSMTNIESSSRPYTLRQQCLRRDGFQCAYSGLYDSDAAYEKRVEVPMGASVSSTECARIIPLALRKFDEKNAVETENKATIWFALHRYFPALEGKIDASSINQPENAITLIQAVHGEFGRYKTAFWPTEKANRYIIKRFSDISFGIPAQSGRLVMDVVSKDSTIPLPSAEYFKVHYRVSEILHVSGIGEKIKLELDMAMRDPENMSPDGSTDVGSIISRRMLMNV